MLRVAEMFSLQTSRLLQLKVPGKRMLTMQNHSKTTKIKSETMKLPENIPEYEHELFKNKNKLTWKVFNKFLTFLNSYSLVLQSYFPDKFLKTYRILSEGSRSLFSDMKTYSRLRRLLFKSSNPHRVFQQLTRAEMETFLWLPGELVRVAPVMAVSALPLAQNVVFPLALLFPTTFLSSHFWTQQQKDEVARESLIKRHNYYKPTFRKLQEKLPSFRGHDLHGPVRLVLGKLGSGIHPNHAEILRIASCFGKEGKFHPNHVSRKHAQLLLSINGYPSWRGWLRPHHKLSGYSKVLSSMDRALDREGIDLLDIKELRRVCNLRGLNVDGVSKEGMVEYLLKWNIVSCSLAEDQFALLLHLPLFIGYNHHNRFWAQDLHF